MKIAYFEVTKQNTNKLLVFPNLTRHSVNIQVLECGGVVLSL